jgi:tetratricopeptide (TPR) repeat protein
MRALPVVVVAALLVNACSSGGRRNPAPAPRQTPAAAPASSVQALYESGQYAAVVSQVAAAGEADAETVWLAAQSHLRLGQRDEAARLFGSLPATASNAAWTSASELALARIGGDPAAMDRALAAAGGSSDWIVLLELGLVHFQRGDFAAAADALDRSIALRPRFAYAHYYAGLAYNRINRADLMVARFDTFLRLAPSAPERPEVESILRTVGRV